ncbi:MAG TPA: anti-sigma factor, partial [Chloroflexota bacterium]|nr:anti-sigma factor [Chloroflexota bacterium]
DPATDSVAVPTPTPPRPLGGFGRWAGGLAVAVTAVAVFTSAQAFSAQRDLAAARAEIAQLRTQIDSLADLASPGARVAPLQGAGPAASATGQVVFQPSGRSALFVLDRLPALEPGRIYQLWLLKPGGAAPTPAGTFTVDPSGRASVVVRAPDRLDTYTGVGLTAEPAPGRPAPTGPILATGSLT